jgi:vacuolar-type H+-ATPase subunit I/STV1
MKKVVLVMCILLLVGSILGCGSEKEEKKKVEKSDDKSSGDYYVEMDDMEIIADIPISDDISNQIKDWIKKADEEIENNNIGSVVILKLTVKNTSGKDLEYKANDILPFVKIKGEEFQSQDMALLTDSARNFFNTMPGYNDPKYQKLRETTDKLANELAETDGLTDDEERVAYFIFQTNKITKGNIETVSIANTAREPIEKRVNLSTREFIKTPMKKM